MRKVEDRFVIPMFHPAAALHQAALKPFILADFARLPEQLNEARVALGKPVIVVERKQELLQDKPKQLSLF
jgi:DNA polymerase